MQLSLESSARQWLTILLSICSSVNVELHNIAILQTRLAKANIREPSITEMQMMFSMLKMINGEFKMLLDNLDKPFVYAHLYQRNNSQSNSFIDNCIYVSVIADLSCYQNIL